MPQIDGQLKSAQLEELASTAPSPAARSRAYSDITDTSAALPTFHNGTSYRVMKFLHSPYVAKSADYTATLKDEQISCNANSAAFTITLPTAVGNAGKLYSIKKTDSTFNAVTVEPDGAETLEGASNSTVNTQNECLTICSDGANWYIVERFIPSGWVSFTPSGSWLTNTTYSGFWRRKGDSIDLDITLVLAGAPTAASLTITMLPTGLTLDTAKMSGVVASASPTLNGHSFIFDAAPEIYTGYARYSSSTVIAMYKDDGDGTVSVVNATAPMTFASGDNITVKLSDLPITGWKS